MSVSTTVATPNLQDLDYAADETRKDPGRATPHAIGLLITLAVYGLGTYAGYLLMNQPENYGPGVALIVLLVVQLIVLLIVFSWIWAQDGRRSRMRSRTTA